METTEIKDPKDEQITNEDTAVTNKDGNNDLEQGKQPNAHEKPDVDTVIPTTDDSGDPTTQDPEAEDSSNKGKGPKGENL